MIAQRPNWATLYTAKGGTYRALENFDEARRWQGEALRLDPDYPYALPELGWLAYWDGDNAQARTHFEKALVLTDETNIGAHAGLGYTLFALGDTNTAIRNCERAASIDARQPDGPGCLGYLHEYGTQDYGAALSAYRKVIALRPYWELGHVGVGRV